MKPLRHTGDSANIAYYAEPTSNHGDVFAEVLRSDPYSRRRRSSPGRDTWFDVTTYRIGTGQVARTRYAPRSQVPPGPLDAATVTRLVRQALTKQGEGS